LKITRHVRGAIRDALAGGEIPVLREDALQIAHRRPAHPQVGIAPVAEQRVLPAILVADVQAADETDLTVHDENLTVIAEVDLKAAAQEVEGQELADLAAGLTQVGKIVRPEPARTDRIVEEAHLHAGPCLGGERREELSADAVR